MYSQSTLPISGVRLLSFSPIHISNLFSSDFSHMSGGRHSGISWDELVQNPDRFIDVARYKLPVPLSKPEDISMDDAFKLLAYFKSVSTARPHDPFVFIGVDYDGGADGEEDFGDLWRNDGSSSNEVEDDDDDDGGSEGTKRRRGGDSREQVARAKRMPISVTGEPAV